MTTHYLCQHRVDEDGYSAGNPDNLRTIRLQGGADRTRVDVVNATRQVQVQWTMGPSAYDDLMVFYRQKTNRGLDSFYIDLIIDRSFACKYEAKFVTGSHPQLAAVNGQTYLVRAELEVFPNAVDEDWDTFTEMLYDFYGGCGKNIFVEFTDIGEKLAHIIENTLPAFGWSLFNAINPLEDLVNEQLPHSNEGTFEPLP